MYSFMIVTEPLQCEEVPVSGGVEEECLQNGDRLHRTPLEEGGTKPEEELDRNGSASSPSEGQQ